MVTYITRLTLFLIYYLTFSEAHDKCCVGRMSKKETERGRNEERKRIRRKEKERIMIKKILLCVSTQRVMLWNFVPCCKIHQ